MAKVTLVTPASKQPASQTSPTEESAPRDPAGAGRPGPALTLTPKACPSCKGRFPADALFCSLDGSPLTTSPSVIAAAAATDPYLGREILGHIEIRQLVGIGAMGRVYRAFQRGIDRDVAVKVLHRELSSNETLVARFDREAKVASRLAHPNVVHVLLVGQLPDGAMYIVMEYLDGLSLQSALSAADGAMPLPRALHVALQLCDAAGEGHAQGIVHRDLKPENVMLVRRADDPDFVKVLDFGIARVHWGEPAMATAAGLIFGTARYISPEGSQGEHVGPAGDVYSIATMLYQMLSGRTPFNADQAVAVLVQQIHDPPPPLLGLARSAYVPEPIAAVIMKNLAKRPEERSPDARAFGRALLDAAVTSGLSAQEVLARPSLLGGPRGSQPHAVQMPSMQRTRQLTLEPETASRIDAVTAYETPAPALTTPAPRRTAVNTEISDPFAQPPGMATTKWAPPAGFEARLAASPAPGPTIAASPLPSLPSLPSFGVDETMDDQQIVSARSNTVPLANAPVSQRVDRDSDTAPPVQRASRTPAPVSRSPSGVDITMAGDGPVGSGPVSVLPRAAGVRAPVLRGALLGFLCFLVGALGMVGLAWKLGPFGRLSAPSPVPNGPAIQGFAPAAAKSAAAVEAPGIPALPPLDPMVPARSKAVAPPLAGALASSAGPAGPGSTRVIVDASNAKPGVGQPVDFEARIGGARSAKVEGARFLIAGPGIAAGTELPAPDDGTGVFRTTFTFLQEGRFEVAFTARADKAPVRGSRVVVVGDPGPAPAPPTPAAAGEPAAPPVKANGATTGANTKWL